MERQEWYSRRYNIIIVGIPEPDNKSPHALAQKVSSCLANVLGLTSIRFNITQRLGPKIEKMERRVIVKFLNLTDKQVVWEARHRLKNKQCQQPQQHNSSDW